MMVSEILAFDSELKRSADQLEARSGESCMVSLLRHMVAAIDAVRNKEQVDVDRHLSAVLEHLEGHLAAAGKGQAEIECVMK